MLTTQALAIMALWTTAMISLFNLAGFGENYSNPIWALGAAIVLVVTLVGNVWIFIHVAKDEPWEWNKNSDSEQLSGVGG